METEKKEKKSSFGGGRSVGESWKAEYFEVEKFHSQSMRKEEKNDVFAPP